MWMRRLILVTTLLWHDAGADDSPPPVTKTEQATAQRAQADLLRADAEKHLVEEQRVCYGKFLVSDCLDAARKKHSRSMIEVRTLEKGIRDFEREEHRKAVEAKEAERLSELDGREAAQAAQGERYRAEEERRAAERDRKLADKARQAEEGRKKREAEEAAYREKQAKRARQDAERAAKKAAAPAN